MIAHSGHVMTLANSIIGVGILAMPFCFQKCGIILATLLLIASNWITRICCHYLIKCSLLTRRKSFEFLGFHAFGTSGKLLVELCIIGYLLGTCITYFVVVGDLGPQIVTKMLSLDRPHLHLRSLVMIAVTLVCILPLGMLKNVGSLSTVCTASIGFYFCLVIKIVLESEEHIVANNWTDQVKYWQPSGILQCLPIFSMALSCQMQLFEVFESINNQSLDKLNGIVKHATWICTCVYIAVGFFGYVAFCTQTFSGNILMNLSQSFGSDVIKIGFVLSVAFSFPLVIFPCRASIYSLLYRKGHTDATGYIPESRFKAITIFIVIFALSIALMIPSVELIIGLVGSTIGVAICIMFPACCYRKIVKKDSTERMLAHFILVSGFCVMILGTFANLNAIDAKRSGAHLHVAPIVEKTLNQPITLSTSNLKLDAKDFVSNNLSQTQEKEPKSAEILNKGNQQDHGLPGKSDIIVILLSSQPPLPIDERHEAIQEVELENLEHLPSKLLTEDMPKSNLGEEVKVVPLAVNKTTLRDSVKNETIDNLLAINSDAIKKEEEIVAEELRNVKSKYANEDLKNTQNELKKTNELLQRTVGELKQELAKQNEETQNLVAEKLDAVAEKVRQIERDVNKKETQEHNQVTGTPQSKLKSKDLERANKNKSFLEEKLVPNAVEELPAGIANNPGPSYRPGELIENSRNMTKLEQRLSIPLPLLINGSSSHNEVNMKGLEEHQVKAEVLNTNFSERRNTKDVKSTHEQKPKDHLELDKGGTILEKRLPNDSNKEKETPREDGSLIRRELLEVDPQLNGKSITPTGRPPSPPAREHQEKERFKRSSSSVVDRLNFDAIHNRLEQIHSLPAVEIDTLMSPVGSRNIDFKIGRDLKAIKEDASN